MLMLSCIFSGMKPEQLGFNFFSHPKKGFFNSNWWRNFSIFSLTNLKSFILNVPGTYPAWKINGEMIAGMMSPSFSSYPPELKLGLEKNWIISGKTVMEVFKAFELKKNLFLKNVC